MKQCPVCKTTYPDDSLQFCLEDGTTLFAIADEEQTQIISAPHNPIRVNIAQDTSQTVGAPQTNPPQSQPQTEKKGGMGIIIGLLVALLALVVLGSAGVIGWLMLKDNGKPEVVSNKTPNSNTTPATPNVTNSQTPDETAKKIANLEKQIQEQKNAKNKVPTISNTTPPSTKVTARVNSPGDGFLALRTEPSAETGDRILQIPHGSTVTVIACLPRAGGKKGRWCRVDYSGNVGWAFDGFLIY